VPAPGNLPPLNNRGLRAAGKNFLSMGWKIQQNFGLSRRKVLAGVPAIGDPVSFEI